MGVTNQGFDRREFLRRVGITAGGILVANTFGSIDEVFADEPKKEAKKLFKLRIAPENYDAKKWDVDRAAIRKGMTEYNFWDQYSPLMEINDEFVPGTAFSVHEEGGLSVLGNDQKIKEIRDAYHPDILAVILNGKGAGVTDGTVSTATSRNGSVDLPELFHELGHAVGNCGKITIDDEYPGAIQGTGFNTSKDKNDARWKGKKGIVISEVKPGLYIFEKDCLMECGEKGRKYGLVCENGLILAFRSVMRPIASAPEGSLEAKANVPLNYKIATNDAKSYPIAVEACYKPCAGDERTTLITNMQAKYAPEDTKDWKKLTVKKDKAGYVIADKLPAGAIALSITARDKNPAILYDPENVTVENRVLSVDVK